MRITKFALAAASFASAGAFGGLVVVAAILSSGKFASQAMVDRRPKIEAKGDEVASKPPTFRKTYYVGDLVSLKTGLPGANSANAGPSQNEGSLPKGSSAPISDTPAAVSKPAPAHGYDIAVFPIIELIVTNIEPGRWRVRDTSGVDIDHKFPPAIPDDRPTESVGVIVPFPVSMSLIIQHTEDGHAKVANILKCVRRLVDAKDRSLLTSDREPEIAEPASLVPVVEKPADDAHRSRP